MCTLREALELNDFEQISHTRSVGCVEVALAFFNVDLGVLGGCGSSDDDRCRFMCSVRLPNV